MKEPNIDLSKKELENSRIALRSILANNYILHLKTRMFQWNLEGETSKEYQQIFEKQYHTLVGNMNELAQRLRILGFYAPINTAEIVHLSEIAEESNVLRPKNMIEILLADNETMIRSIRDGLRQISSSTSFDEGTEYLLRTCLIQHETFAWDLRSILS